MQVTASGFLVSQIYHLQFSGIPNDAQGFLYGITRSVKEIKVKPYE
jgi:hypothetical protein